MADQWEDGSARGGKLVVVAGGVLGTARVWLQGELQGLALCSEDDGGLLV